MPYFRVVTFGCKVNQVDSAGLHQGLVDLGWEVAPAGVGPELILVNTCTVTARADQEARQVLRRLARQHPGASVWVTGCYAQRAPGELALLPGVQGVAGNLEKGDLPYLATGPHPAGAAVLKVSGFSGAEPFQALRIRNFPGHTRAWLKVQEGCGHACSYCIVPHVRGRGRSLPPGEVAAALRDLGARGYQEVVLTGVDLGQYGRDLGGPFDLAGLLKRLAAKEWPFRLRLSSLEPQGVSPALLKALPAVPQLCPHFHLPLQSGSRAVLAAMHRPYGPEDFRDRALSLLRLFPEAALGLDILAGFPGETPADFAATWELVNSLPVAYLHVFPFSPRPGTPAAALPPLDPREVRRRAGLMRELGRRKKAQFYQRQLGQAGEVLVEGPTRVPGWLKGLSGNYLRVLLPGPPAWQNRRLPVRFKQLQEEILVAEVLEGS